MAKIDGEAPDCFGSSLGSNSDISQKYKMGDISKGEAYTLYTAKNKQKNFVCDMWSNCWLLKNNLIFVLLVLVVYDGYKAKQFYTVS